MKWVTTGLLLCGVVVCALFIALAYVVKWLWRPAIGVAAWLIAWHFVSKYW
jgi:hypothetical protein